MQRSNRCAVLPSRGAHWILDYHGCKEALKDPRLSSDVLRNQALDATSAPIAQLAGGASNLNNLIFMDGSRHAATRAAIAPCIPSASSLRSYTARHVKEIVAGIDFPHEFEVVRDFASPIAAGVACEVVGIAEEVRPTMERLLYAIGHSAAPFSRNIDIAAVRRASLLAMRHVQRALQSDTARGSSFLGSMRAAERLPPKEVVAAGVMLAHAAYENTRNLLALAALMLLHHPVLRLEFDNEDMELRNVSEELIRLASPAQAVWRVAMCDIELDGVPVRMGTTVLPVLAAANRDPARFHLPDAVDRRRTVPHLAFGGGVHSCPGAGIARMEMLTALGEFSRHLTGNYEITVKWNSPLLMRGPEAITAHEEREGRLQIEPEVSSTN